MRKLCLVLKDQPETGKTFKRNCSLKTGYYENL